MTDKIWSEQIDWFYARRAAIAGAVCPFCNSKIHVGAGIGTLEMIDHWRGFCSGRPLSPLELLERRQTRSAAAGV